MSGSRNRHHRKPQCQGGDDEKRNISRVSAKKHAAWHMLFDGEMTPQDIADVINRVWLDPDYILVVKKRRGKRARSPQ